MFATKISRNTNRFDRGLSVCAILLAALLAVSCGSTGSTSTSMSTKAPLSAAAATTVANLQTAFDGESNASARYTAFAAKADSEGYAQVASLFRAAAKAEAIHAENHASVLRDLGATPAADVKTPDVKDTAGNLKAAIEGESYERDTMYPQFISQARSANLPKAVQTMNFAQQAEAGHAQLYSDALAQIDSWRDGTRTFYVCTVCGNTTAVLNFEKCPACFSPKDKFVTVS
jgi:rubrerythrin